MTASISPTNDPTIGQAGSDGGKALPTRQQECWEGVLPLSGKGKDAGAAQTPFYAEFADKNIYTNVGTGKKLRAAGGPHNVAIPK